MTLESQWADLVYQGLWFSPLKNALDGFIERTQHEVNGTIRIKLHKGNAIITGRKSANNSLYVPDFSTYTSTDKFDHKSADGFIYIWGLPSRIWAQITRK